jgi:hypothetical protein
LEKSNAKWIPAFAGMTRCGIAVVNDVLEGIGLRTNTHSAQ